MFCNRLFTELKHITKHGNLTLSYNRSKVIERGIHAGWIGIICIDYEDILLCAGHLRTVIRRHISLNRLDSILE